MFGDERMLKIHIEEQEFYNSDTEKFFNTSSVSVRLEHSLISISKWEAIWEKPFLPVSSVVPGMLGQKEERSYVACMIIGEPADYVPDALMQVHSDTIRNYIEKKHTATIVYRRTPLLPSRQIITSELIYYWMLKFGIPFECQRWHLNRLLTLIDVCSVKESSGGKGGKLSTKEASKHIQDLNKARKDIYEA